MRLRVLLPTTPPPRLLLLLLLLLVSAARHVNSHGWLVDPVPASGGGTGSGNASQRPPCGNLRSTAVTAAYIAGSTVSVGYRRANSHGVTANSVAFRLSYAAATAAAPTSQHFQNGTVLISNALMNVSVSGTQTTSFALPSTPGLAVMQFEWIPTSGGAWYDCAFIRIESGGACSANNGGCHSLANCAANGNAVSCTCRAGYFGDGRSCNPLPPDVPVQFVVALNGSTLSQDNFTAGVATLLNVPVGRILYDRAEPLASGQQRIYMSIGPDPVTGADGSAHVNALRTLVGNGSPSLSSTLGVSIAAIELQGGQVVAFGAEPSRSGANGDNVSGGTAFAIVVGSLTVAVAWTAAAVMFYRRGVASLSGSRKGAALNGGVGSRLAASSGVSAAIPPPPPSVKLSYAPPVPAPPPEIGEPDPKNAWGVFKDDEGREYYFNSLTGESRWERPAELY